MYTMLEYRTLDQLATDAALELLAKAEWFRLENKPEEWARNIERKALRKFEYSFEVRHMFGQMVPRPAFLPPGSYSSR